MKMTPSTSFHRLPNAKSLSQVFFTTLCILSLAGLVLHASGADTDGDGIRDEHEEILGTDPAAPESFRTVLEDGVESETARAKEGYDATKDFLTIEFGHVGGDRYLWRATFAETPRLEETTFHLYLDADANESTGRKVAPGAPNHGTEYMVTVTGGNGGSTQYDAEGNSARGPSVRFVVDGKHLLMSSDLDLGRDGQGIRYDLYILCHTASDSGKAKSMSDSSGKFPVSGIPLSGREKIMRPADYTENHGVAGACDLTAVRATLRNPGTIEIPHDQLEVEGFSIDHETVRRWPHVSRDEPEGRVWTKAPRAGRYHAGFLMYDDSNDDRVAFYIGNEFAGVAVANRDNNRTWLYWLEKPLDFKGGERVELHGIGSSGKHGIGNILFLKQTPDPWQPGCRIENMTSFCRPEEPGRVSLSWTTSEPCPTRFEYGPGFKDAILDERVSLVHRVALEDLKPDAQYSGRAVAAGPDGSLVRGEAFHFSATPPPVPQTEAETHAVPLAVDNPHPFAVADWPMTSGVPFPQGKLGRAGDVRLRKNGEEIPLQTRVMARWRDGSVKWLLVDFPATVPAGGTAEYRLEFGRGIDRKAVSEPVRVSQTHDGVVIDTGAMQCRVNPSGNLTGIRRGKAEVFAGDASTATSLAFSDGGKYDTLRSEAEVTIEEQGPLRVAVKTVTPILDPEGKPLFEIIKRIEACRGSAFLRVHHTFTVMGEEKFSEIEELSYRIPVPAGNAGWMAPLADGGEQSLDPKTPSVQQRFDREFVTGAAAEGNPRAGRIAGTLLPRGEGGCAIALRDFWQNYPKAFSVGKDGIEVGLCPSFEPGLYDKFPFEKEGHHLYYYLLDGRYRLKRGVSKTHELFLCFDTGNRRAEHCAVFQRPLLATAPPEWYCGSKAFYSVAPRDEEYFKLYEEAVDKNIAAYAAQRERQHDYGMLNYGDWYGERGTNWGNVEYDTQHALFLEYIRSGNPDAFFLGAATEIHNRDIDTVHWNDDASEIGAVYVHQMCHVGDYYDKAVPGSLGFPQGGYTVSHAWTEGHFDHAFLTGDRRSWEAGSAVADFFIRKELGRPYNFSSCRTPGWHLIMLASAYAATNDPYYLNAAKVVVDWVLESQDTEPRPLPDYQKDGREPFQAGGWSRMMHPGHCQCIPRHRGNAGFMVAILLSGLKYYHDVTGDPRVREAIIRGARNLLDETYSDEVHGFRYTSCPATEYRPGASFLMVEGIARAYLWTGDERFRRVLTEALPLGAKGSGYGKGFTQYYRIAPRVLADLKEAGIKLSEPPE